MSSGLIFTILFLYFLIGGICAGTIMFLETGFRGKVSFAAPLVFFFWPVLLLLRYPVLFVMALAATVALILAGGVVVALGV